jgi:hypothetical protein
MNVCCCTGDVVQFTIAGRNTGNMRISGLFLLISGAPVVPTTITCMVENQQYGLSAFSQLAIEPQQRASCAGTYTITPSDIAAGDRNLTLTVSGLSTMGIVLGPSQTFFLTPAIRRTITAAVALDLCSNATATGM